MDTMKVHARVLDLLEGEVAIPGRWLHDLVAGSLTYGYSSSPNTFKWNARAVASIARDITHGPTSNAGRELLKRWSSIREMIDGLDDGEPSVVLVDYDAEETTLVWEDKKVAVVIEHDRERELPAALASP